MPIKKAPVKKAPIKKTPVKKVPIKKTPVKKAPIKKTIVKKTPIKKEVIINQSIINDAEEISKINNIQKTSKSNIFYRLFYLFLFLIIGFLLFIFLGSESNDHKNIDIKKIEKSQIKKQEIKSKKQHLGVNISDILNEENYKRVGINPDDYETMNDFLFDLKSFTGVTIDPINQNFSVSLKQDNGNSIFIPYRFQRDKDFFNTKENKNLAILDIYNGYKTNSIHGGYDTNSKSKVIFEDEVLNVTSKKINDKLSTVFGKTINTYKLIESLESSSNIGYKSKKVLGYLYDFTGNYDKANNYKQEVCKDFNECDQYINYQFSGQAIDLNGKPIKGVNINSLNYKDTYATTDKFGKFSFTIKVLPYSHIRFRSTKLGYSDAFSTVSIKGNMGIKNGSVGLRLKMMKADKQITINSNYIVDYKGKDYYKINHLKSIYHLPVDGLHYSNGNKYKKNNFEVYLYFFTKDSNMTNMLVNDTFTPVYSYVGNIMKTFGMPYIQFFDRDTKKELFVMSSNPMILQNTIHHMKELYDNYDKVYSAITDQDMKNLLEYSNNSKKDFPIDFEFLTTNNMMKWPGWWALDREKGIWNSVPHRLINLDGLVELPFYSIKNN